MKGGRLFVTIAKFINEVGFKVREGDVKKVNDSIKSIKSTATKLLGAIGIGFSLTKINALVEEFGAANKQITSAVGEMENMDAVQGQVLQKANAARLAYTDMAGYVSNLAKAGSDIFPVDDAIQFTSTVAKLMKTNGRNDSAISSMMEGFNKSFQKGIVDTETLNKMLEQAPETANVLAQSLGVAKSQLLDMASNGKMTVQQLKDAFMDASGEIDAAFQNSNMSISDGLKNIRNNWGLWLTQMNSTLGVTNAIARAMVKFSDTAMRVMNRVRNAVVWLGDKLGGTDKVLKLIAISAGALFIAFNFDKIVKGVQAVFTGLRNVNKQALLMAAAFIIVALLVEDFINFMQGNNSLLGSLLEKAGVDVDKFRANIIKIWGNIKTILTAVWQGIKNVAIPIFQTIWGVIKTVFEAIGKIIDKIAPQFVNLADQLANGNIDTDKWVKVGEAIAKIIAVIVGVVAAVKTVIAVVRTVTSVVKGVSAVISFVSSPVGLVILAIMALIAVGILLYKNWDKIKAFAIRIWTAIKDFFVNIFTSIGNFFTSIWEGISTFFSGVWNGIKETVSGAVSAVWETISTVFSTIWEFISGVATNIWTSITTAFTNILSSITGTIGNIKDSIVTGFTAAIDWIKALPAQAVQWGKDIIDSIVSGIKSAVSKVGEAVSGVASKIKGFLGFSEPDEGPLSDFHTYMPDMIDLMAKGISAGKAKVRDALGALTGDMSIMAQANVASPTTARTAMGSNSVSKSVVQNVNINNKFEGDRAGQQKSAAAMDKAAGDSTGEMARALSYAR
jgi:tape measure domain-containing protein|nr:MAG TPA: tail tape measure protein [Caudoviricetes sp.]